MFTSFTLWTATAVALDDVVQSWEMGCYEDIDRWTHEVGEEAMRNDLAAFLIDEDNREPSLKIKR